MTLKTSRIIYKVYTKERKKKENKKIKRALVSSGKISSGLINVKWKFKGYVEKMCKEYFSNLMMTVCLQIKETQLTSNTRA